MAMSQELNVKDAAVASALEGLPTIDLNRDAIFLDIDGTLLDIALTPEQVWVPEQLRQSLDQLMAATGGALALVSGRTLESIDNLFAPFASAAISCHGAQLRRSPHAQCETLAPTLPEPIKRACADIPELLPGVRVENKTFALAFHYRLARDQEKALLLHLRARIAPFESDYALMAGKSIFEIKPKNSDKGASLRALMRLRPFAGRRPVFFGDDTTDKYAFAVLSDFGGLGVSVGHRMPHAGFMVDTPRDVRRWLAALATR
jgi:trehalose 6-phosphate phosphatase